MSVWFSVTGLSLKIEMTNIDQISSNHHHITLLGIELHKYWKNHLINTAKNEQYYTVRPMHHLNSMTTFKIIYFAYFHWIIMYGIVLWGNSVESKTVFQPE